MLIGKDFDKIELNLLGLDLLEPNAFITDLIILLVCIVLMRKTSKLKNGSSFYHYWYMFFGLFGLSFFIGGLGHLMYNYWGMYPKITGWYLSVFSILYAELAMISIFPNKNTQLLFRNIAFGKTFVFLCAMSYFYATMDMSNAIGFGLFLPSLNSFIGLTLAVGVLGVHYHQHISRSFQSFWIAVLIGMPAAAIQIFKVNPTQWFDRNDLTHLLFLILLLLYYQGIHNSKVEAIEQIEPAISSR